MISDLVVFPGVMDVNVGVELGMDVDVGVELGMDVDVGVEVVARDSLWLHDVVVTTMSSMSEDDTGGAPRALLGWSLAEKLATFLLTISRT